MFSIKITPNDKGNPVGKLADVELRFTEGPLTGLKLIGFALWEKRGKSGEYNLTMPARTYSVNGDRRTFSLLRPIVDVAAYDTLRAMIIDAYVAFLDGQDEPRQNPSGPWAR